MHGCNIKGRTFAEHVFPPGKMPGLYKRAWFTTWMVAWSCGSNCFTVLKAIHTFWYIYICFGRDVLIIFVVDRVSLSLSLSLSCSVSDLCQRWWISCFSIRQAACLDVHLFLFLNGGFLQSDTPKSFLFCFPLYYEPSNYWGIPIYGQPPNTDLPRNGFLTAKATTVAFISWMWRSMPGASKPLPEPLRRRSGVPGVPWGVGYSKGGAKRYRILLGWFGIWDAIIIIVCLSMLVCYSMASCHTEHITHEAVWGSSFGLPHTNN